MEIGTVISCLLGPNRDGTSIVRLAQCMVSGPTDIRTIQIIGNADHYPVPGAKVQIDQIEQNWEVGTILEDIAPAATTLIGDKVIAADLPGGVPAPLSQVSLRAAAGGSIELGGATDYVTAFIDMKIAFDQLKADFNALVSAYNTLASNSKTQFDQLKVEFNAAVTVFNAHPGHFSLAIPPDVVPAVPMVPSTAVGPASTASPSAADMTAAQVASVKVP
jgi:hypothetical protein